MYILCRIAMVTKCTVLLRQLCSIDKCSGQGIQQVRYGTITIETGICPMADRATQMGPMAADTMGPYV